VPARPLDRCYRKHIVVLRFALFSLAACALVACAGAEVVTGDDEVTSRSFSLIDPENPFTPEQPRWLP
jgi:hypothetical protein